MKAFEFIKEELAGWYLWEVIGLLSACAIITVLSIVDRLSCKRDYYVPQMGQGGK